MILTDPRVILACIVVLMATTFGIDASLPRDLPPYEYDYDCPPCDGQFFSTDHQALFCAVLMCGRPKSMDALEGKRVSEVSGERFDSRVFRDASRGISRSSRGCPNVSPEASAFCSEDPYLEAGCRSARLSDLDAALRQQRRIVCNKVNYPDPDQSLGLYKMADDLPIFPKASKMYIHSGNIINWNRLKRKPNISSTDELCEIISNTLGCYIESSDKQNLQYETELYKVDAENVQPIEESERGDVKVTVKLVVSASEPRSSITDAMDKVLRELGTNFVETLLLAVSRGSGEEDDSDEGVSLKVIQKFWEAMEELVSEEKVLSLGICDLSKNTLESLYEWAKIKPSVNQVNLQSCCVMPQDLTEYAKAIQIQLLTHNDSPEFLTKERLQETIQSVSTERDSDAWVPEWIVRYSCLIKCRGIIKMKGYLFHASRDNNKRIA